MSRVLRKPVRNHGTFSLTSTGAMVSVGDKDTVFNVVKYNGVAHTAGGTQATPMTIPDGTTDILIRCRLGNEPVMAQIASSTATIYLWEIGGAVTSPSAENWISLSSVESDGTWPKLQFADGTGANDTQTMDIFFFKG